MNNKKTGRYSVPSNEDFEPGFNEEVLANYLGITFKEDMEELEKEELDRTILSAEKLFKINYQFSAEDLCALHEEWLGDIYPVAGRYRTVTMSKDGFLFAAPEQIPRLMKEFEKNYLAQYTPCNSKDIDEIANMLAIVHIEFVLIHPFREGNGRLARLLSSLMATQAGLPPLDFEFIDQNVNMEGFKKYINAIHLGVDRDYSLMKNLFKNIIEFSRSSA